MAFLPSIVNQITFIKQVLDDWARNNGGIAVICHDLREMWEQAYATSQIPRCLIAYVGEEIRGDVGWAAKVSRVDRTFNVMVTRARGYTANRGDTLVKDNQEARPFYDLLEEARDIIRIIQFDPSVCEASNLSPVDFKSITPALPDNQVLDAYIIDFSIGTQLRIPYSNFTSSVTATTIPSAPFNLSVTSGSAILNWQYSDFNAYSSSIQKSTNNGVSYNNYADVGKLSMTYTDTNVTSSHTYYYRVARYNAGGTSSFSNTASIIL
jgi:hypothetical protein